MQVQLVTYQDSWPRQFAQEAAQLAREFQEPNVCIEHIGSTAIPGLMAKPVIDILIGLPHFEEAPTYVAHIQRLGYTYVSMYEEDMPYRRFFTKDHALQRTHQIHMVALNSPFWNRHIAFRDYLRAHNSVRDAYAELKQSLAQKEWASINDYAEAKTPFIRSVEKQALNL